MAEGLNTGPFKNGPTTVELQRAKTREWEDRPCATPDCTGFPQFSKDYQKWCHVCFYKLCDFEYLKAAKAAEIEAQAEQEAHMVEVRTVRQNAVHAEMAKRRRALDAQVKENNKAAPTSVDVLHPANSANTNDWEFGSCPKCKGTMNVSDDEKRCWTCGHLVWKKEPEESDYLVMAGLMSASWDGNDAGE